MLLQLEHSDATLVDLLNDVKNKLAEIQAGELKLKNDIDALQVSQKKIQKELETAGSGKFQYGSVSWWDDGNHVAPFMFVIVSSVNTQVSKQM